MRKIERIFMTVFFLAAVTMLTFGYGQKAQASSSGKMTIYSIDLGKWNSGEATMIAVAAATFL